MSGLRTDGAGTPRLDAIPATTAAAPLGDPRQDGTDRLIRLEVGRQFQAQIVSRFYDGTFMVRIADTAVRIALPGVGEVGDALALTLISADSRVTFSLDSLTPARRDVPGFQLGGRIAQALSVTDAAPTGQVIAADNAAGTAAMSHLSETGRLLADLLNGAQGDATVTGTTPLCPAAGANAPQLASALKDALVYSGLFYESHVSQWVNGERPLADLLREPQAHNSPVAPGLVAAPPGAMPGELPSHVVETRRNLLEYFTSTTLPVPGKATIDAGAAQMINIQLNTLDQQKVQWQGNLWPGQPLHWEVRRGEGSAHQSGAELGEQRWQSEVRFTLPNLGMISATITLAGQRVQVQVRTANEAAAMVLRRHAARLASALDVAGSPLHNLTVKHEAPTNGSA